MKRIGKLAVCVLILLAVFLFGGYNWLQFSNSVELRSPEKIFSFLVKEIPSEFKEGDPLTGNTTIDVGEPDPTDTDITIVTGSDPGLPEITNSNNNSNNNPDSSLPNETLESKGINIEFTRILKISVGDSTLDLTSSTSADIVKWLAINHSNNLSLTDENGDEITGISTDSGIIFGKNDETEPTSTIEATEPTDETEPTELTEVTASPSVNTALYGDVTLTYSNTLEDKAHLEVLIADIEVVDKLPNIDNYDRDTFEKPVKSYLLGGIKVNRNNYAWMSSPFFNQKDFTYTCPYTGKVITDLDDKKQDNDFGNLDYDHIVPLKSAYLRGASEWSKEKQNEYAYDQWVAVDVLASANRSKGDKGPLEYLPTTNVEDYCYSWLLICSKYDLVMTQAEIDLCKSYIETALQSGEPVTHLGGSYSG